MRSRPWRPARSVRLIDAENLAGNGRPSAAELAAAAAEFTAAIGTGPFDHTVVAAGPAVAFDAGLAWPGAQLLVGLGPDGADAALLEWAARADLVERFDRLVVGSGDFAFASLVADLRGVGVSVTVVARAGSCSRALSDLCEDVRLIGSGSLDLRDVMEPPDAAA
jgi:hypothetical protein